MRIIVIIMLALASLVFASPFALLVIDVWSWLVLGSGVTPVDWTFIGSYDHVDHVGKPILAMLFLAPAFVTGAGALVLVGDL